MTFCPSVKILLSDAFRALACTLVTNWFLLIPDWDKLHLFWLALLILTVTDCIEYRRVPSFIRVMRRVAGKQPIKHSPSLTISWLVWPGQPSRKINSDRKFLVHFPAKADHALAGRRTREPPGDLVLEPGIANQPAVVGPGAQILDEAVVCGPVRPMGASLALQCRRPATTSPGDDAPMRQADTTLERFPGPVTLHISRRRRLGGLGLCLGVTAIFAWVMFDFANPEPQYRGMDGRDPAAGPDPYSSAACTVRAAILLLVPGTASLTLDSQRFRDRPASSAASAHAWRDVSGYPRARRHTGPPALAVRFGRSCIDALCRRRRGAAARRQLTRALPDNYGLPRLCGDDLAWLMNEWRRRALARRQRAGIDSTSGVPRIGRRPQT